MPSSRHARMMRMAIPAVGDEDFIEHQAPHEQHVFGTTISHHLCRSASHASMIGADLPSHLHGLDMATRSLFLRRPHLHVYGEHEPAVPEITLRGRSFDPEGPGGLPYRRLRRDCPFIKGEILTLNTSRPHRQ